MDPISYQTIATQTEAVFRDKNSRFIAIAVPVKSETDIQTTLGAIRKNYHDARHFCYAYILGHRKDIWRANDDGEPSGSAGLPIYNQLLSYELTNVLVVVVRYFGGIKLGVPGLIHAYKTSTRMALDIAEVVVEFPTIDATLQIPFAHLNQIMQFIKLNNILITEKHIDNICQLSIQIPLHKKNELNNLLNSFNIQVILGD